MKRAFLPTAIAAALVLQGLPTASAQDYSQLAASADLTAGQAGDMTLAEIFVAKINRESGRDERQVVVADRATGSLDVLATFQLISAAGIDPSEARGMRLADLHVAKINHNARRDEQVVVVSTRSRSGIDPAAAAQLAAAAGLDPEQARGMSLDTLAAYKVNAQSPRDEGIAWAE